MEHLSSSSTARSEPAPETGSASGLSRDHSDEVVPRSVSIVVPTFNEAENVERVISRCRQAMDGRDYELLIVDDDSPDGTWQVAEAAGEDIDEVRVLRRQSERGLGTAVVHGFERAKKDFCLVIDADLQHPPELIPELANHVTEYVDVVIGSRYRKGGQVVNWPLSRQLISRGAIALTKLCLAETRGLNDPLSGFFLVRRSVVDDVDLEPMGYKILLEVLVQCEYGHVVEVPYQFDERRFGQSKLTTDACRVFVEHLLTLRSGT
jgi:dolichol-phosphate mannosyltransferase